MTDKIIIKNGRIFDAVDAEVKEGLVIEIENGRIAYIGKERDGAGEAKIIDASDKFIMPGIIDCHMHIAGILGGDTLDRILEPNMQQAMVAVKQAEETVKHGITTACEVSMTGPYLKKLIDNGVITGPRLLPCGQGFAMGGGGPYVDPDGLFPVDFLKANHPWGEPCDGAENLRQGIRMRLRDGCEAIKIWSTGGGLQVRAKDTDRIYTDEELIAICDEAAMAGIPVLSHCESIEGTKAALRCGVKCILHGVELDDECIELMKEKGAWLMPTLNVNLGWPDEEEELERRKNILDFDGRDLKEKECNRLIYVFKNAHQNGVKIALGSDTYCGARTPYGQYSLEEMKLFVNRAGIDIFETLMSATRYSAEALGIADKVGTLETGKIADVLILNKDITKDINLLEKRAIETIIKDGNILSF